MLILAFLTSLTVHLLLFSYSQLKESIILEMHLTHAEAGFIFSMSFLALILLRIPWGLVIDRLGFRVSLGLALTLLGVFGLLRGFAVNYETLLLSQLFLGVGFAAVMPCLPKLASAWFPPEKAGFAIGVAISGFAVGDIIGLSATPYLLTWLDSWKNVFFVYGFWALILAGVWWILAKEPEQNFGTRPVRKANPSSFLTKNFVMLLRVKQVWLLTGLYLCASACYDTFLVWLPSMLEAKGIQLTTAGLITSMLPLGFFVASFAVGSLSDRVGLRKPFILILGLISGPAIYAAGTLQGPAVWFFAFVTGLCTIGVVSLVLTIPVELPQTAVFVGSAVGLISSFGNLGSFFMPTIVGYVKDVTGSFFGSMLILAVLSEFMLILGLPLTETGRKRQRSVA
jgi:ACS family D-galactonate transporter-like MFS transporter